MTGDLSPAAIGSADELRDAYGRGDGPRCDVCGTEPITPDVTLAAWPRPWRDGADGVLCADCWAAEAAKQTVLTQEQATVAAVQALGYDIHEMASAQDGIEGDVREILDELRDTRLEVEDEMDELMRTAKLFDSL
jgi:hypothetical protein